jgi:hypothetical protein
MAKPIENPDLSNTSPDYWEKVLQSHGLGVNTGSPERRRAWGVGGVYALTMVEEQQARRDTGVVQPCGAKPKN